MKQNGGDVIHGAIREVSLVLAGANPGAKIENIMAHGDNSEEEAIIYNDSDEINLAHSEEKEKMEEENKEKTVKDVIDSMTEEQRNVMYALIGEAIESTKGESYDDQSNEEENKMKHNAFENEDQNQKEETQTLSHSEFMEIVSEAKRKVL